jgi:peptidyl-dipeptidase A
MKCIPIMGVITLLASCALAAPADSALEARANQLLQLVNSSYQALYKVQSEAQWAANTDVKPEHDAAMETAGQAMAAFSGNPALINEARALLASRDQLSEKTVRQLDRVLLNAAEGPMTNPDLVAARIAAETAQASTLNGFVFKRKGQPISVNEIDRILQTSTNLEERKEVWSSQSYPESL